MTKIPCCFNAPQSAVLEQQAYLATEAAQMLGIKWMVMLRLIKRKIIKAEIKGSIMTVTTKEIERYAKENNIFIRPLE